MSLKSLLSVIMSECIICKNIKLQDESILKIGIFDSDINNCVDKFKFKKWMLNRKYILYKKITKFINYYYY